MGPFKKCTCITALPQRRFRFEGFQRNGHQVGAASVIIHEGGCQGVKGGNKPQVWLFKCGGSTVAKIDHNNYLHPRADHSGRLLMQPGLRHLMEDYIATGNWKSAIKAVQTALVLTQGDSGHNRLRHFPKVSTPQCRPKKEANPYKDLIETKDAVSHRMEAFKIEGQPIGPLMLVLDKGTFNVTVYLHGCGGTKNLSQHGNVHPHVDTSGYISFGNSSGAIHQIAKAKANPAEMLFAVAEYLRTDYVSGDSYCQIARWNPPKQVFALNVRVTRSNDSEVECWGIFTSRELAEARLIQKSGITWHTLGVDPTSFDGHRNTDCDDHYPGLVEAHATIDTHIVQE